MSEQSNLSAPGNASLQHESATTNDSIELIESEMEALRLRMKRLEIRLERLAGTSSSVPLGVASNSRESQSTETRNNIIPTPESSHQKESSSPQRRPLKRASGTKVRRTSRKPRKTRSSKFKRNLLLGYGLLIGVGVVSVFVLMILNLFNAEIFLPRASSSPPVEIELNETPNLEELRKSIGEEAE